MHACVHISLFFKGRQALDLGPTLIQEDIHLITSAKTLFPHKVMFTGEGVGESGLSSSTTTELGASVTES